MLCLVKTKACKRCRGDLSLERDRYGTYMECIQCGAIYSKSDLTHPSTKVANNHQTAEPTNKPAVISYGR